MVLDQNLLMVSEQSATFHTEYSFSIAFLLIQYFREDEFVFAHDPEKVCKTGDIVLVRELAEKLTTLITHKVEKVVYPLGDIVDPITGKLVVVGKYRDQIEEANRLFGKSDSGFDYNKAPPRGRLEGDRDLTDKETYRKYHDDGVDDPYAW